MEYKVIMPILSDTMDKGKIVKWLVSEGDKVTQDTPVVEVESDKATMDIEAGADGIIKKILHKAGEEVPVKEVIAIIETQSGKEENTNSKQSESDTDKEQKTRNEKPKKQDATENKTPQKKENKNFDIDSLIDEILNTPVKKEGSASPAAKKEAEKYGLDIDELQKENELPKPAHLKDIQTLVSKKYFTPKAWHIINEYGIDISVFNLDHKISTDEVRKHIKQNDIPLVKKLSPNQLAVIKTVNDSAKKPVYFVFEEVETSKKEGVKLTANIIKALANAMQKHPLSRAELKDDTLYIHPASNISVAVHRDDGLYMAVIKNAEDMSLKEINEWLKNIKTKRLTLDDLTGSTFGISNLGMTGIESFSALINNKDAGIAAFGAYNGESMKVTFTFDHRIMNGYEAALFVSEFKKEIKNV